MLTPLLARAQEGDPASATVPEFTFEETPLVTRGDVEWNSAWNEPGAVIYHDGLFHLFTNSLDTYPEPYSFGYLSSDDGQTWSKISEQPLFTAAEVPYSGFTAALSSVLVQPDGTWVLYFYWLDQPRWPIGEGGIGRATAPAPQGPWTVDDEPVLVPGSAGEWDDVQVSYPHVIPTEEGYLMYYTGWNRARGPATGMASSADGITWAKYDDPASEEAPFAESDPVHAGESRRYDHRVPRVWQVEDGSWRMFFTTQQGLWLAISDDGVEWQNVGDEAFLRRVPDRGTIVGYISVLPTESGLYLFVESNPQGLQATDIMLGYYEGDL
jgi:predicted GH43/DUF377 family glycosyl hydrolase